MDSEISENVGEGNDNSTDAEYVPEEEAPEQETPSRKRRREFAIWKYFKRVPPLSQKRARCSICLEVKSHRTSSTNLKSHLKFRHPKIMEEYLELSKTTRHNTSAEVDTTETDLEIDNSVPQTKPRWRDPTIWKYFKKVPPDSERIAKCNYCQQLRSYRTSITNLKTHLSLKHPEVVDQQLVPGDDSESEQNTKPNRKLQKTPKKIVVSKLFKIDDSGNVARCRLCSHDIKFTTTDTLKHHIIKLHGEDLREGSITVDEEELHLDDISDAHKERHLEDDSETSNERKYRGRSKNWEYFELVDEVNKIARCNTCGNDLSYSTISNLRKHLFRMHSKLGPFPEFECSPSRKNAQLKRKNYVPQNLKRQQSFRSSVWKYYDIIDEAAKLATCRLCNNNFNYKGLSNLRKHLRGKHEGELSSSEEEVEIEILEGQNSTVWAYFKCLSQDLKIASCLICKKRVDYNDEHDLSKHLSRKHPQVQAELNSVTTKPKKLMITGNGDIYEIDEDVAKKEPITVQEVNDNDSDGWPYNNDETDALDTSEYLDENIFNEHKPVPAKKRRKSYQKTSNRHEEKRTQITNTQNTLQSCEESSLDIFGKYIISLLKKLPKHKSDRLQADFVQQIMEAQNDTENTRSRHTVHNTHTRNTRSSGTSIDEKRVTSDSEMDRVHSKFLPESPPPLVAIDK